MIREQWGGRKVMALRAQWQPRVSAGGVPCGQCGLPIDPSARWKLGHLRDRALGGTIADGLHPEHARCSDASGGRLAARLGVGAHARTKPRAPLAVVPAVERRPW